MSKRNRRGTGWVFERDGVWHAGFKFQGQRYRWSSGSTRKTDATDMLDRKIRAILDGTYKPRAKRGEGLTVKALAAQWLDAYVTTARNAKGKTLASRRVDLYITPFFREMSADKVTRDSMRAYRAYLETLTNPETKKRALSVQTVRHLLADLRCLFFWAVEAEHIPASPVPRRLLPKLPQAPLRSLTPEAQERVMATEEPYGLAVRLMMGTGVRWSELCRLQASDVQGGELVVHGETKSRRMRRVSVPPAVLAELKGRVGKLVPFGPTDVSWFIRAVRLRSDVQEFSAHACRHSFGFNYMAAGGNLLVLKELMGHSTVELTAVYARPSQALVREDARRTMGWAAGE